MKMTSQEIFDFIVDHLRSMKRRCTKGPYCSYLNRKTNSRCAVGALFPVLMKGKKITRSTMNEMENLQGEVDILIYKFEPHLPKWFKDSASLLKRLQFVHDNWVLSEPIDEHQLKEVAKDFNLVYKEKI